MIEKIASRYGISNVRSIEKLEIKSTNELYKVVSGKGSFLIKKLTSPYKKEENILAQIDIAFHLSKKGISTILPLKNIKGDFLTPHYKKFYLAYPYVEIDRQISSKKLPEMARILSEFHRAMEDYKGKHEFYTKPLHTATLDITNFTRYDPRLKRGAAIKKIRNHNSCFAKKVRNDAGLIKKSIKYVLQNLGKAKFTKKTILHYDYNKENLFFQEGKIIAVSDFDYSHRGYVESDVAKAAKYWSEKDGRIKIEKFRQFVDEYSKHNSIAVDWNTYHMLVVYLVLRRIVHAAQLTLDRIKNLEYLYDYDMRLLKFLTENREKFIS